MSSQNTTVCVTGASGFIGSYVVRELLQRNYKVRAGVIDKTSDAETQHLQRMPSASRNLQLFNVDLTDRNSLEKSIRGCAFVMHLASPTRTETFSDVERDVLQPAREGTLNLLRACESVGGVRRVIFTSCITSMIYHNRSGQEFDLKDDMWSDETFLRENRKWYQLSKTMAEKAAWQFMDKGDRSFQLVCIQPGLTLGPILAPSMPFSLEHIRALIEGEMSEMEDKGIAISDVRDVALAHINLMEQRGTLQRRYVCVSNVVPASQFLECIRRERSSARVPSVTGRPNYGFLKKIEDHKLQDFGFHFTGWEKTVQDTITSFNEHSLL